ncbi:MAG: FAD-dependent oxidoreductase [Thermoleophilia bacterium]
MAAHGGEVLVAGAGFAGLEAALALRALTHGRVHVRLLTPANLFTYVPAAVIEPFQDAPWAQVPLSSLSRTGGFVMVKGMLGIVEPEEGAVITTDGRRLPYDALIVAVGARRRTWLRGADITFRGTEDVRAYRRLVDEVHVLATGGAGIDLAIVVPSGPTWSLPAYELALLTAAHLRGRGTGDRVRVTVVTAEERPLSLFGTAASEALEALLHEQGVSVRTGTVARSRVGGALVLSTGEQLGADRVVTMAALSGPEIPGLPATPLGFLPVEQDGRVPHVEGVLAAGDATDFPVKQGGVACQMADTAAATAAIMLGHPVDPVPFAPRLRGQVWSGGDASFIRGDLAGGRDESAGVVSAHEPLWWPPGKVAGRFLTPALEGGDARAVMRDLDPRQTPGTV